MGQHWVPKMYLKYFADKKERISIFDIQTEQKHVNQNIEKWVSENNYNTLKKYKEVYGDENYYENLLSKIEGETKIVLERIINGYRVFNFPTRNNLFSDNDKAILSKYICLQLFRTKKVREILKDRIASPKITSDEKGIYSTLETHSSGSRSEDTKEYHINSTNLVTNFLQHEVYNCKWYLKINNTNIKFVTSDSPVLIFGMKRNIEKLNESLSEYNSKIIFPLSPNLLLEINGLKNNEYNISDYIDDEQYVKRCNDTQKANALRYLFFLE